LRKKGTEAGGRKSNQEVTIREKTLQGSKLPEVTGSVTVTPTGCGVMRRTGATLCSGLARIFALQRWLWRQEVGRRAVGIGTSEASILSGYFGAMSKRRRKHC